MASESTSTTATTETETMEAQRLVTRNAVLRASSNMKKDGTILNDDGSVSLDVSSSATSDLQRPLPPSSSSSSSLIGKILHSTILWSGGFAQFVVHFGLFLAFLTLTVTYCVRTIHDEYFVTMVEHAKRTDGHLQDQLTYYKRYCNALDLTIQSPEETTGLWVEYNNNNNNNNYPADDDGTDSTITLEGATRRAVDNVMRHGLVMIPQLLQGPTISTLREYVIKTNAAINGTSSSAIYPIRQNRRRVSFGLVPPSSGGGDDDGVVARALKEIYDHPLLYDVVRTLVGDTNPAITEIGAITASFGAVSQTWRPGSTSDGNALMYGRTYQHSYSLYIPLQDTTSRMGPADVCIGTHYCADDHLVELCANYKIGLNEISRPTISGTVPDEDTWREGDGVLFNQQIWHRWGQHRDREAPDQVVFVVSFMGRPTDTRQLARGTYFLQNWMNWGVTWEDLADSHTSMARPWSILRSLHLWKARHRQWGYDLFTATAMRLANNQPGMQGVDLIRFIDDVMVPIHFPDFLYGVVQLRGDYAWQLFLRTTLDRCYTFSQAMNIVSHTAFVMLSLLTGAVVRYRTKTGFLATVWGSILRVICSHGLLVVLAVYTMRTIHDSKWAKDIKSGEILKLPFPDVGMVWREDDPMVSSGLTTLPERFDVLIGSRLNGKFLGTYRQWLDHHPGNVAFDEYVKQYGGRPYHAILSGESVPKSFAEGVIQTSIDVVERHHRGRFLDQDYRTGDWRLMTAEERIEYIKMRLFVGGPETLWYALKEEIDTMLDENRFGMTIRMAPSLSWYSQLHVSDLGRALFTAWPRRIDSRKMKKVKQRSFLSISGKRVVIMALSLPRARVPPRSSPDRTDKSQRESLANLETSSPLSLWKEVDFYDTKRKRYFWGTIVGLSNATTGYVGYDVAVYGKGVKRMGSIMRGVRKHDLVIRNHIVEGEEVQANFALEGKFYPAEITFVLADANVEVKYRDGDVEYLGIHDYMPHNSTY